MKITYRERRYLDRYRCIDTPTTFYAESIWSQGGLLYCRTDRFNIKVIEKDFIIKIEE